ncbi:MAG: uridylate kinase [Planctomycetaceae bacterium]|nr:uridylate kinase [Planctomycetaceae bacterium]MBT6483643.1 uridylate kinase [Planctomycetaceae bacterium]
MKVPAIVVYKIGGSLLDLPDLPRRLQRVVPPDVCPLFVVGGGQTADLVREWDRLHQLGDERAHWLALRAMQLNEALLAELLPDASVVATREAAISVWGRGGWPIVSACDFAAAEEPLADSPLPHCWEATSDSVAAWIAARWPAERLMLLKSGSLPEDVGVNRDGATAGRGFTNVDSEWVAAGLVDSCFPAVARELAVVEWINLRDERPASQRMCFPPHPLQRENS